MARPLESHKSTLKLTLLALAHLSYSKPCHARNESKGQMEELKMMAKKII